MSRFMHNELQPLWRIRRIFTIGNVYLIALGISTLSEIFMQLVILKYAYAMHIDAKFIVKAVLQVW